MNTKTTTSSVIESTKYLCDFAENKADVISGICKTHRLTPEFVIEFKKEITPEMFMTSYMLPLNIAERFPNLYNEEEFKELMKATDYEVEVKPGQNIQLTKGSTPSNEAKKLVHVNNLKQISLSMLAHFINDFKDKAEYELNNELIISVIRNSEDKEFENSDELLELMGINAEIDELLLKRVKNEETKHTLLLALSFSENSEKLTSASYKYMTNDLKEDILGTENINAKDFVNSLSQSNDLGWCCKMINDATNGVITIEPTNAVMDKELAVLFMNLPESYILKFISLSNVYTNAFSYKLMKWVLENKEFSEDELISMKDVFKKAGLFFDLRKFAVSNNYTKLIDALKH